MNEGKNNKIAQLDTAYAKEQYAEFQKKQKKLIFRRRRLAFVFFVAVIGFALVGIQLFKDYQNLQHLETLKQEALTEQEAAKQDVSNLNRDVALLEDENYVAKLARSKFFYSKEGEIILKIPEKNETSQTQGSNETTESTTTSE